MIGAPLKASQRLPMSPVFSTECGKLYRAKYAYSRPEERLGPSKDTVTYASVPSHREGSRD
jgi:hypothetical protein